MKKGEILTGLSVSSGIGIGEIHKITIGKVELGDCTFTTELEEKKRLKQSIDFFCYRTYTVFQKMRTLLGQDDALILGGQIFMARDLEFVAELDRHIEERHTAEEAVSHVFEMYLAFFHDMEDELMAQRGADLMDMRDSILEILLGQHQMHNFEEKKGIILCTNDLSPSLMSTISPENVSAILCQNGGITSHCAILARATGIPAIFGVKGLLDKVEEGDLCVVDGDSGMVMNHPLPAVLEKYHEKAKHFQLKRHKLEEYRGLQTKNASGTPISLMANISDLGQMHTALELGADGVGLLRTEYLFMGRRTLPTEEEQIRTYHRVAGRMEGKPVMIRTLDIGGDKEAECLVGDQEDNPFLGQRAVRYCLEHRSVFLTQLRAILQAAHDYPNIALLIPFVTDVDELLKVEDVLEECRRTLEEDGKAFSKKIKLGVVVETPAAAIVLDHVLEYVDYVSVGTNDLTQYIMATDRGNAKVAEYYSPFHLSVVRVLQHIIKMCNEKNVPVTVCGEAVADPRMIPLLMSFGELTFSVSPSSILLVRRELANWTEAQAEEVRKTVMKMKSCGKIEKYLNEVISDREQRLALFDEKVEQVAMGER